MKQTNKSTAKDAETKMDEAKEKLVMQITEFLEDKEIRSPVFRKLSEERRERHSRAEAWPKVKPPASKTFPDDIPIEERERSLEEVKEEINGLYDEIHHNKMNATGLMGNAVKYAKQIGDRLLYVKGYLVSYGNYENWIEENFDGGLSTARAYTRIAKFKNWQKIAPKLYSPGGLTLEKALALLKERSEEKKTDARRKNWVNRLSKRFHRLIETWSDEQLCDQANGVGLMDIIDEAMRETGSNTRQGKERNYAQDKYRLKLEVQRAVLKEFDPSRLITDELMPADMVESN